MIRRRVPTFGRPARPQGAHPPPQPRSLSPIDRSPTAGRGRVWRACGSGVFPRASRFFTQETGRGVGTARPEERCRLNWRRETPSRRRARGMRSVAGSSGSARDGAAIAPSRQGVGPTHNGREPRGNSAAGSRQIRVLSTGARCGGSEAGFRLFAGRVGNASQPRATPYVPLHAGGHGFESRWLHAEIACISACFCA